MKRITNFFNVDFLQGPIIRSLVIFAIPLFISSIFQQMYNMVDTMIVAMRHWQRWGYVRRSVT